MTNFMTSTKLPRLIVTLAAGAFMLAATEGAPARNGGDSDHRNNNNEKSNNSFHNDVMKSGNSDHDKGTKSGNSDHNNKDQDSHHKDKDKDKDKYKDANKDKGKDKDKDKGKGGTTTTSTGTGSGTGTGTTTAKKPPVIVNGGFVLDKTSDGTSYYRRATKDEMDQASKAGGATTGTGTSAGTGTASAGTPPAAPPAPGRIEGSGDPVVRDHRPGGNAGGPVPGTIIRDHRDGADGTPKIVVSNSGGVLVTRNATDAELVKAGLKKPAPPASTEVSIGIGGGGR